MNNIRLIILVLVGTGTLALSALGQNAGQPASPPPISPTNPSSDGSAAGGPKAGGTSPTGSPQTSTSPNASPTAPLPASSGTMSTIVVTAATDNSILPNDQAVTSVFGTDISVQDTPRSVTVVSAELQKDANIQDITDFAKVAPSAYTTVPFGFASVPNIRGQLADVFINGMERTTRGDGPPTSFNSVEQTDIVSGPPTSILGPTANTGGYVNFVTKQPYFDRFHSDTQFSYGSYDEKVWDEDFGGPIIKDELAYRMSYEGNYSGSYYDNVKTNSNDGFIALAWKPSNDFHVDFNSELYDGRFNEVTGWNRPTQGLIDGHNYSTGLFSAAGAVIGGNPNGTTGGYPATGTFGGIINSPGTTRLSPETTLVSPVDSDFGKDLNAELTETYTANENLSFINRTYYEYFELRNAELAQLYTNLQTSHIIQDRAEVHLNFDTPITSGSGGESDPKDGKDSKSMMQSASIDPPLVFKNEIVTGIALKYVNVRGFGDYFNESLNGTDLSMNGNYPLINNQKNGTAFYTLGHVPDTNFEGTTGLVQPNTTQERGYQGSAFFQHQLTFTPQWGFIYSGRADLIYDDLSDPIPNGDDAIDGLPNDNYIHYATTQLLGTGDASITYKPASWVTNYLTFDFNESTAGNSAGGFDSYSNSGQSHDYHFQNFLYEGGAKFDLMNHTLFTTVDGYYQTHNTTTTLGATSEIRTFGAEISTSYQPDKHFSIVLNESYLNAKVINPGAELTGNVYDAFSTSSVGVSGTGFGAPNFVAQGGGTGDFREAGLPQFLLTGVASYKLDCGVGASLSYQITDPINTSELANVWIPWQYEIDASLFYTHKQFSARVTFFNVTDQHNFSTGGYISGSGNDLISISEPFHVEGTIGYQF